MFIFSNGESTTLFLIKRKSSIGHKSRQKSLRWNRTIFFLTLTVKYTICWFLFFNSSVKSALENDNATFTHSNIKPHRLSFYSSHSKNEVDVSQWITNGIVKWVIVKIETMRCKPRNKKVSFVFCLQRST